MSETDKTQPFADNTWRKPVPTPDDLPKDGAEGQMCWVDSEGLVYQHRDGKWITFRPPAKG